MMTPRRTSRLLLAGAVLWPFLAGAFLAASAPPAPEDPSTRPASAPAFAAAEPATSPSSPAGPAAAPQEAEEPADLVKAVLSYDPVEEHTRFLVACGRGQELSAAAFRQNRKHRNPFARPFDRWENLLLFDRDGGGTISWAEAGRYRVALRKAILAAFDADRDGQLTGEERDAANKALSEGNLPPLAADANPASQPQATSQPASAPAQSSRGEEDAGGLDDPESARPEASAEPGTSPDNPAG